MRLPGAIVVVLAPLALLLGSTSALADTWSAPVTISAPGEENAPADVALAPDGTVIAVWQRADCKTSGDVHECDNGVIQYSVRPPGGSFSPPAFMPGDQATVYDGRPQVAVDAAGNALAIWAAGPSPINRLFYSVRPAGGAFGDAKMLKDELEGRHSFPSLAVAPDGRAVVTFARFVEGVSRAGYAVRSPGGDFGTPRSMAADPSGNLNEAPEVHIADSGEAIANWTSGATIRYARLPPGATEFEATQTIEEGGNGRLAMAPSGAAVMIWNISGSADDLRYAFRSPGADFGSPTTLVEPDGPLGPRVAIDAQGRALAAWSALIAPNEFVRWAAAPPGGPFGPPVPMPPGGEGILNDLEMDSQGTALALWVDVTGSLPEMRASLRPPGGVFGDPAPLPGPPQGASLFGAAGAIDAKGNAAAVWSSRDPFLGVSHDVPLLASVIDAPAAAIPTPPEISDLRVRPRRFRVGRKPTAKTAAKAGTSIRFRLSEQATVRLTFQRARPGVRVKVKARTRCLAPTARNRRRAVSKRRCTRFRKVGRIVRRDRRAGANKIGFSGRIGRKALRTGRHRVVAVAIDQSNELSQPRRAGFRVLR